MSQIRYLKNKEINKEKWDACIHQAPNKMIYVESIYLDSMAVNWDAIIVGNYEAVLPLLWKRKFGIKYLYQPAFIQQGGIYGISELNNSTISAILELAKNKFKFAEITFNFKNTFVTEFEFQNIQWRNNFILPIDHPYEEISSNYNTYLRTRIRRSQKNNLVYLKSDNPEELIALYRTLYHKKIKSVTSKDYLAFESLCHHYKTNNQLIIRKVYDDANQELLAAVLLFKDKQRIYNIVSCVLPNGKKLLANYFLYDALIKEFSNQRLLLDFEGSDIPGVSFFYKKFTSINQAYAFVKWNRLPKLIQWIKK